MTPDPRTFIPVAAVFCVTASFVVLGGEVKDFSHEAHLEQETRCGTCHDAASQPPKLKRESCRECHDEEAPAWRLPARAVRLKANFAHKKHAGSLVCIDCHQKTASDSQKVCEPVVALSGCVLCHDKKKVELPERACIRCHGADRRSIPPGDHRQSWSKRHGKEARWREPGDHGRDCSLCHRKHACLTCHKTTRPRSHTALWRTRTHGMAAQWDRDTCKTCHETGICIRCHRTTAPLNHRGAWEARHGFEVLTTGGQQCSVCHSPAECATCHIGR